MHVQVLGLGAGADGVGWLMLQVTAISVAREPCMARSTKSGGRRYNEDLVHDEVVLQGKIRVLKESSKR